MRCTSQDISERLLKWSKDQRHGTAPGGSSSLGLRKQQINQLIKTLLTAFCSYSLSHYQICILRSTFFWGEGGTLAGDKTLWNRKPEVGTQGSHKVGVPLRTKAKEVVLN